MKKSILFLTLFMALSYAENGMISYTSHYNVEETTRRLVEGLRQKGVTVFKVIDHSEGARRVGLKLSPTRLVIFGNPKMGTPLMQCSRTIALDLPQKMLIYENGAGKTIVTYNDPRYLVERHGIDATCAPKVQSKMEKVMKKFAKYAAGLTK